MATLYLDPIIKPYNCKPRHLPMATLWSPRRLVVEAGRTVGHTGVGAAAGTAEGRGGEQVGMAAMSTLGAGGSCLA
jgi:hypothetical protein